MSLTTFTSNTTISSSAVNANFSGLSDGTLDTANNSMANFRSESNITFVASGLTIATSASLSSNITTGVAYIGGVRVNPAQVTGHTFTASKDTYVWLTNAGAYSYQEATNNAAPTTTIVANAILIAIVVTSGTAITSVNQGSVTATAPVISSNTLTVCDSSGNLIYPTAPTPGLIAYRQFTTSITGNSQTTATQVPGLSCPVIVSTNRRYKVTAFFPSIQFANLNVAVTVWDGTVSGGGTQVGWFELGNNGSSIKNGVAATTFFSPTSSPKTYNVATHISVGSGTFDIVASASKVAYVSVELV